MLGTRFQIAVLFLMVASPPIGAAADLERVRVSDNGRGFVLSKSGKPFVPWGFNYDHEGDGQLLEDYWDDKWPTVESAFQEMKELGANVVRIHLQFGKFMDSPTKLRQHSLNQLSRLVKLAEQTGLYLDLRSRLLPQKGRAGMVRQVERAAAMAGADRVLGSGRQDVCR